MSIIANMPAPALLPGGHGAPDQLNSHSSEVSMTPSAHNTYTHPHPATVAAWSRHYVAARVRLRIVALRAATFSRSGVCAPLDPFDSRFGLWHAVLPIVLPMYSVIDDVRAPVVLAHDRDR